MHIVVNGNENIGIYSTESNAPEFPNGRGNSGKERYKKLVIIAGLFMLVTVVASAAVYYKFFFNAEPELVPKVLEPEPPPSLIRYEKLRPLEISDLDQETLRKEIKNLKPETLEGGSISYIPVKLNKNGEVRYISLKEFLNTAGIRAPFLFLVLENMKEYMIYSYTQESSGKDICKTRGIQNESCYGPRLGLIIRLDDKNYNQIDGIAISQDIFIQKPNLKEAVDILMKEWEKTIVKDMSPLILSDATSEESSEFKDGYYKNQYIRYTNLFVDITSVDWAIVNDFLVISTAKHATREVIDRIISEGNPTF